MESLSIHPSDWIDTKPSVRNNGVWGDPVFNIKPLKPHHQSCFYLPQQKRKLRIFISNTFNPAKSDAEDGEGTVASWELRVEGRLLEDVSSRSTMGLHLGWELLGTSSVVWLAGSLTGAHSSCWEQRGMGHCVPCAKDNGSLCWLPQLGPHCGVISRTLLSWD